jgi:hypothetical protein
MQIHQPWCSSDPQKRSWGVHSPVPCLLGYRKLTQRIIVKKSSWDCSWFAFIDHSRNTYDSASLLLDGDLLVRSDVWTTCVHYWWRFSRNTATFVVFADARTRSNRSHDGYSIPMFDEQSLSHHHTPHNNISCLIPKPGLSVSKQSTARAITAPRFRRHHPDVIRPSSCVWCVLGESFTRRTQIHW